MFSDENHTITLLKGESIIYYIAAVRQILCVLVISRAFSYWIPCSWWLSPTALCSGTEC